MALSRSLVLAAAIALCTACGGGGDDGGPAAPGTPQNPQNPQNPTAPSAAVTVDMRSSDDGYGFAEHSFSPTPANVSRNGTVTWVNSTNVAHNVTFTSTGAPPNIPDHTTGSNSRTFPAAGTFNYQCTNHPGMTGVVTVP